MSPSTCARARSWLLSLALTVFGTFGGTLASPLVADASAQQTAQGVTGVVRDAAGNALAGVTVEVRNAETGYVVRTTTATSGRYAIFGLPSGGPYLVRVRRLGLAPAERGGIVVTGGARPTVDFVLLTSTTRLGTVAVRAGAGGTPGYRRNDGRESRAGGSTRVTREQLDALPVTDRNFAELAALSPLAGPQFSLGGQRWTSTDFRIDGAQARNQLRAGEINGGPAAISLEAVREVEVNTSLYDVALGRQGGGQVTAVTRSGSNVPERRFFAAFRNAMLAAPRDFQQRTRDARRADRWQTALSGGGPLVRDRAHWFAAYERQDASDQLVTGDVSTPDAEIATGIARDSLARVIRLLGANYGVRDADAQLGRLARKPASQLLFARIDWQATARQRATLRFTASDWRNPLSGGVDQPVALRESRSSFVSREWQWYAALSSQLGADTHHELQLTTGAARRALTPEGMGVPRGFVQVRSLLRNGVTGTSIVQFGGNRLAPDDSREWQWQLQQRVTHARGSWLFTAGQDHAIAGARTLIAEAQGGLFVFPSIQALAHGEPDRFTRTVPLDGGAPETRLRVLELGAYAQTEWQPSAQLSVTGGIRWDASAFLDEPPPDSVAQRAFAIDRHQAFADWRQWQPRMQLVWRVRDDDRELFRLGAGWFNAQLPYYLQHNQLLYTGRALTDVDLRGSSVPRPDYAAYRSGAAVPGLPSGSAVGPAYLNVTGDVRSPRTFKASAAWARRLREGVGLTLSTQYSRQQYGYHYVDRNLRASPAFRLPGEASRAVWVPASSIPSATGVTDVRNASANAAWARVLSLESPGGARHWSGTAELTTTGGQRLQGTVAYAYARTSDNSTFGCCLARTATTFTPIREDPRDLTASWSAGDADVRHRVTAAAHARLVFGVQVAARYAGSSGRPFSLVVDGDINGDEANGNDLAFVFDPDDPGTPADVAAAMRRVLGNPRNVARRYLARTRGDVSARNAVRTPFTHRVDARLSRTFALAPSRAVRRVEVMLDLFNVGNLLDARWGAQYLLPSGISAQNPVVNRVPLLRVVGFDQAQQRFRYVVNENAGVLVRGGEPWQLQLALRLER